MLMKKGLGLMLGISAMLWITGCQSDGTASVTAPAAENPQPSSAYVVIPGVTKPLPTTPGCFASYAPVCTEGYKTYANKCLADAAKAKIIFRGACPRIGPFPSVKK